MDVRINHVVSTYELAVRVQTWEEKERQVREAIAAGTCPECGSRLVAAGGCLECPCCGWAACS
jgi:hypothetical protein